MQHPPPTDEPSFVLTASDPAAPFALLAYASAAHNKGYSDAYVSEIRTKAQDMYQWQDDHGVIAPGKAGVINAKISAMFQPLPDDHPTTKRLERALDARVARDAQAREGVDDA